MVSSQRPHNDEERIGGYGQAGLDRKNVTKQERVTVREEQRPDEKHA